VIPNSNSNSDDFCGRGRLGTFLNLKVKKKKEKAIETI